MTVDDLLSCKLGERARWRKKKKIGRRMMKVMLDQWMEINTDKKQIVRR